MNDEDAHRREADSSEHVEQESSCGVNEGDQESTCSATLSLSLTSLSSRSPPRRKEGRKRHGARNQNRHKNFCVWLKQTFPKSFQESSANTNNANNNHRPNENSHILDVAGGGKGELAARLCMCLCVNAVVVDPRPADIAHCYETLVLPKIPNKWQHRVQEQQTQNPNFISDTIQARFRQLVTTMDERTMESSHELQDVIQNASLLIGLHADGATEAIVDAALKYGKPFVVVPCCVFPTLFPQRTVIMPGNKNNPSPVRTHDQFCQYLVQKHPDFCMTELPFEGRNTAIWWCGPSPS